MRIYQKEFREVLEKIYGVQGYFRDFFGGNIEALDGVSNSSTAFTVKTSDIPVIIRDYDTDAETAFGEGTSNSNRFGPRTEVISTDEDVPYTWTWAIHEGIDRHTTNQDLEEAIIDRIVLQGEEKVHLFNIKHSQFISSVAGEEFEIEEINEDTVVKLFNDMYNYFLDIGAFGNKVAKVSGELYNAIIDHPLSTIIKNSDANISENEVVKFKGFNIEPIPSPYLVEGDIAYVYVENVAKAFTGIDTARTFEAHDIDGVVLQGSGKAGEFIPDKNKAAVVKVVKVEETPDENSDENGDENGGETPEG